jgi:single-strand DNA-binding protein
MNLVILTGNLVRDPEKTYTSSNMAVTKFTVAVNRFTRKEGSQDADFIRVTAFDKQAELVEKYMRKGSKIGIEGRLQTGSYEKEGKTVYTTDIIANRVEFLDRKEQSGGGGFGGGSGGGGYGGSGGGGSGGYGGGSSEQFTDRPDTGFPTQPTQSQTPVAPPDGFAEMDDEDMPF